jgi:hypothetical protein
MKSLFLSFSFLGLIVLSLGLAGGKVQAETVTFLPGQQVGTVAAPELDELSGMVASRKNENVLWAHNDSPETGDPVAENRFFGLTAQGTHLGLYNLPGITNRDWEDMAIGPGPVTGQDYLYFGDIGDNYHARSNIVVYRVSEPAISAGQSPVTMDITADALTLTYPDGQHDADTLLVDPVTGGLCVISREPTPKIYWAAASALVTGVTIPMEYKGTLPTSWLSPTSSGWPTAGDVSPDGDEIIIRSYTKASLWSRPAGTNFWDAFANPEVVIPVVTTEPHGEGIGFDAMGLGYYTISEKNNSPSVPIYYYERVPEPTTLVLIGLAAMGLIAPPSFRKK